MSMLPNVLHKLLQLPTEMETCGSSLDEFIVHITMSYTDINQVVIGFIVSTVHDKVSVFRNILKGITLIIRGPNETLYVL